MEKIVKLISAIAVILALGVFVLQYESCKGDAHPQIATVKEALSNTYAGTTWVCKRFEIILSGSEEDDEIRMSMPTKGRKMSLEFLTKDDYYVLTVGDDEGTGKYKIIGGDRLISIKPENGASNTLTVDTTGKQKKLLLNSSGSEAREFLNNMIAMSNGGEVSGVITQYLSPEGETSVKMRAEFTQKASN